MTSNANSIDLSLQSSGESKECELPPEPKEKTKESKKETKKDEKSQEAIIYFRMNFKTME